MHHALLGESTAHAVSTLPRRKFHAVRLDYLPRSRVDEWERWELLRFYIQYLAARRWRLLSRADFLVLVTLQMSSIGDRHLRSALPFPERLQRYSLGSRSHA